MTDPEDTSETRSFELEIEVPGTPEEIWDAIATGPGITAWMHPTEVEEREGGRLAFDMGSGMNMSGKVTGWDPPKRFVEESEWEVEGAPKALLATEWLIEGRGGGTCVVRMVTTGFGTEAAWDDEIEGFTEAMESALQSLRLYLTHFPGQRGTWMRVFGSSTAPQDETWTRLIDALGLHGATEGTHVTASGDGVPALSGVVERALDGKWQRVLLIRVDEPAPGLAAIAVYGQVGWTTVQACLYGDEGATAAAREEPAWRAWIQERFPSGDTASQGTRQ
jgi:uncharacterized protein YndB with AHSA1/START domain